MRKISLRVIIIICILIVGSTTVFAEKALPSQQEKIFPESFIRRGNKKRKEIALTFDDGPDGDVTPQILDILKDKGIKATFFLLGKKVEEYPEITLRIKKEGHQLGNHSWSHSNFWHLPDEYILKKEIKPTSKIIEKTTGIYPEILRPPYGLINNSTIKLLKEKEWKIVNWSIDSHDWNLSSTQIINIIEKHHHSGAIILLHNSNFNEITVKSLPEIIEIIKAEGYSFISIEQLLKNKE